MRWRTRSTISWATSASTVTYTAPAEHRRRTGLAGELADAMDAPGGIDAC